MTAQQRSLIPTLLLQAIPFAMFYLFVLPWVKHKNSTWVISGHKGRLYEDNSKALHEYITQHTNIPIIWISSNLAITKQLEQAGHQVLRKHSLKARIALLRAPVLLYSHAEDDLDNFLLLFRKHAGTRVLLSHSLNYIKSKRKNVQGYRIPKFDYVLASSQAEADNLAQLYPTQADRIVIGGGAHLDEFLQAKNTATSRTILYFPTHRETPEGIQHLQHTISTLVKNTQLQSWLVSNDFKLVIAQHINSSSSAQAQSSHTNISFISPEQLVEHVKSCALFISDYSGVLGDMLPLSRPTIFFPFDIEEFTTYRELFSNYSDITYGPEAKNVNEVVELITNRNWSSEEFMQPAKREALLKKFFPNSTSSFSERTVATIQTLLSRV